MMYVSGIEMDAKFGFWFSLAHFSTIILELITNIIVWLNELELMEYCTTTTK